MLDNEKAARLRGLTIVGYQWRRYHFDLGDEGWAPFWNFERRLDLCPAEDTLTQVRCVYALRESGGE